MIRLPPLDVTRLPAAADVMLAALLRRGEQPYCVLVESAAIALHTCGLCGNMSQLEGTLDQLIETKLVRRGGMLWADFASTLKDAAIVALTVDGWAIAAQLNPDKGDR